MNGIESSRKTKTVAGFWGLFPILMLILDPYALTTDGINLCDILILVMAVCFLKKITFYIPLLALLVVDIILSMISFIFTTASTISFVTSAKIALVFVVYLYVYSSLWNFNIKESFYKWAEIAGIICAVLAILQFAFASFGYNFYDGRLFFPLGKGSFFGGLFDKNTGELRVHSFFEEPSYLAFFELPITAFLFKQKKYIQAVICALSCVFSASLTGVVGLGLILVVLLILDMDLKPKHKLMLVGLLALAIGACTVLYNTNSGFKNLFNYYSDRSANLNVSKQRSDSSFSQRLIGNIKLFNQYPTFNKFFGVGFNQYFLYFGLSLDYSNDVVSNLLNFGYLGLCAFIVAIIKIARTAGRNGAAYFAVFVLLLAIDHAWFGAMFFYMMTWIITASKAQEQKQYLYLVN